MVSRKKIDAVQVGLVSWQAYVPENDAQIENKFPIQISVFP
jgi:hypothetical protein